MTNTNKFSRRSYLKWSAAATASFVLPRLSRAVEPGGRRVDANSRLQVGLIGMGEIMRNSHLPWLAQSPRVEIVAACDVWPKRYTHCKEFLTEKVKVDRLPVWRETADAWEIFTDPTIDAVVIATPDHWHVSMCLAAMKHGKHIYCEKPLTRSMEESRILLDAFKETKIVFQTGLQQRSQYEHRFVDACEFIRNGRIGKVTDVYVDVPGPPVVYDLPEEDVPEGMDWARWLGPAPVRPYNQQLNTLGKYPKWRRYFDFASGSINDLGAHCFDICQWALDMDHTFPAKVTYNGGEDARKGSFLTYKNGVHLHHAKLEGVKNGFGTSFVGTEGQLHINRRKLWASEGVLEDRIKDGEIRLPRVKSHMDNWLDAIEGRDQAICPLTVGVHSSSIAHLLIASYQTRKSLAFDRAAWSYHDIDADKIQYAAYNPDSGHVPK